MTAWVTAPDGGTTLSYFSVFRNGSSTQKGSDVCNGREAWDHAAYGLPFTPSDGSIVADGNTPNPALFGDTAIENGPESFPRYLSTEVRTGFSAPPANWNGFGRIPSNGARLRSSWVTYEHETPDTLNDHDANARVTSSLMKSEDDGGCGGTCYSGSRSFGFDGFGHFRQSSTLSNFPGSANFRTSFTNYDGTLDVDGHWVLGTFSEQCVADEGSQRTSLVSSCDQLTPAAVTKSLFDRANGHLLARRSIDNDLATGTTLPTHDLLAVFEYDSGDHGFVSREKYFGGDLTPLSSSSGFSTTTNPDYQLDRAYVFSGGTLTRVQSGYHGASFLTEDADLDPSTGLVATFRDSAGLATTYAYDSQGRLTTMSPPATQPTSYIYDDLATPVKVTAQTIGTTAGTVATEYRFDDWGRLSRQKTKMYDDQWSTVVTQYDALGRKSLVGVPQILTDTQAPTNKWS
jgi:YD repeat-containing protein